MTPPDRGLDPVQRDFLRHPTRRLIYELLSDRPGLNKTQIAEALGLSYSRVYYHLERLAAVDVVAMKRSPREPEVVCFTADDEDLWRNPRTRILYGGSHVQRIAHFIARKPGVTTRDIADETGLAVGAIHHHLRALLRNRLVGRHHFMEGDRYYPEDELTRWQAVIDERT